MIIVKIKNAEGKLTNQAFVEDLDAANAWLEAQAEQLPEDSHIEMVEDTQDLDVIRAKRALEYPPIGELADAIVKMQTGDASAMAEYVAKCLAVKAKYPKPE